MKKIIFILSLFCAFTACFKTEIKLKPLAPGSVIVAFGNSLTAGVGASTQENSYPQVLSRMIHFTVINVGVSGEETEGGLARLASVLEEFNPKLVILCEGGNDFLHRKPLNETKENLTKMIQMIKNTGADVVLIAVPEPNLKMTIPDFFEELGGRFNIPVNTTLLPELLTNPQYKSDIIHLNDAGYFAFASGIATFLRDKGAIVF